MSLLSQIQNNTSSVVNGKLNLAQAITNKGGTLGNYVLVPTFNNLINGVASIETGIPVDGSNANFLASENIKKGGVCKLEKAISDYIMAYRGVYPTTYKDDENGNGTVTSTNVACQTKDGKFILVQGKYSDYDHPIYMFMRTDDGYVQVTQGEERTYTSVANYGGRTLASHPQVLAYDSVNKRLFMYTATRDTYNSGCRLAVYDVDEETANITLKHTFNRGGSSSAGYFWGYNLLQVIVVDNNVFLTGFDACTSLPSGNSSMSAITKHYYYDPDEGTLTYIQYITGSSRPNVNYSYSIADMTMGADGYLYVAYTDGYSNRNYVKIRKMLKGADGRFSFTGATLSFSDVEYSDAGYLSQRTQNKGTASQSKIRFFMSAGCSYVFYVSTNGGLRYYLVDTENMTATEQTPIFDDGLDVSTVTYVKGQKSTFLYVVSSAYSTTEQLRLYTYDFGTATWKLFKLPLSNISPTLAVVNVPANNTYDFIDGKYTTFAETTPVIYNVGMADLGYDYIASNSNSVLEEADAYGIAKEDITSSNVGKGLLILS